MLTSFIVMQYMHMQNHYIVYLKLIKGYINYISKKKKQEKRNLNRRAKLENCKK